MLKVGPGSGGPEDAGQGAILGRRGVVRGGGLLGEGGFAADFDGGLGPEVKDEDGALFRVAENHGVFLQQRGARVG